jgi:hypothetical protein
MAWSWSHTVEAYDNLHHNLHQQDSEWLRICYAEWEARKKQKPDEYREAEFSKYKYRITLNRAAKLPDDILADAIYEMAEEQALCTSGGHEAHCCPWGCHMLPFDKLEEPADEALQSR